jgi:hypothetical protein
MTAILLELVVLHKYRSEKNLLAGLDSTDQYLFKVTRPQATISSGFLMLARQARPVLERPLTHDSRL